jgi:hypothetical protein
MICIGFRENQAIAYPNIGLSRFIVVLTNKSETQNLKDAIALDWWLAISIWRGIIVRDGIGLKGFNSA